MVDLPGIQSDDPILAHLTPYPDQDTARHEGDDPALAHLTPYPGSDMARR